MLRGRRYVYSSLHTYTRCTPPVRVLAVPHSHITDITVPMFGVKHVVWKMHRALLQHDYSVWIWPADIE